MTANYVATYERAGLMLANRAYDEVKQELEDTYRVLFHVVTAYQRWRDFLPNELSDDAFRIGEEHLRNCAWWPTYSAGAGS